MKKKEKMTYTSLSEALEAAKKDVIIINRSQFIEAFAETVFLEPAHLLVEKSPMMIMLFTIMQGQLWEQLVKSATPKDNLDNTEEKDGND